MEFTSIEAILEFAIEKEKEAVAFYKKLSQKESIADLAKTFNDLAKEEARHVKLLTNITKNKTVIDSYALKKVPNLKISDYLVVMEYSEGMPMQDILILAMKREEAAVKLYTDFAIGSKNDEFTKLFRLLAQEEAKHKLIFECAYDDYQIGQGN
ncbi:MAG: ferritin family protein [Desulfocapsaceae bacterium]|nr:ferritin family protein [Desulfocapsaceae bacterium]